MLATWYRNTILPRLLTSVMSSDELETIRKEIIAHASGVVLEIGCGPGFTIPLYQNIHALYALEPSEKLMEKARQQPITGNIPVTYLESTAENIPLPDQSVDTVVSTWTLCSVHDPMQVLGEMKRVLRPQGSFVFIDHGISPHRIVRLMQKIMTPFTKVFTGNCHHDRNITQLILGAGFTITTMEHPAESRHPLIYNFQGVASKPNKG